MFIVKSNHGFGQEIYIGKKKDRGTKLKYVPDLEEEKKLKKIQENYRKRVRE